MVSTVVCLWGIVSAQAATVAIYPPDINLNTRADRQPIVVVATRADGVTEDITQKAKISVADAAVARLEGRMVHPVADGKTELRVEHDGQNIAVPIEVRDAAAERPTSFQLDVMPVFMRAGCNSGACHGSARGQDGFMLSLFGYDPQGDYFRLTRELGFRRINLAEPADSLLLEKAVGSVPHTGGKRFEPDSDYYKTLIGWIEAGAPNDQGEVPHVTAVEIYPPAVVLEGIGSKQTMIARAKYSDGTDRDVTDLAVFFSNNDNAAPVSPDGVVTAAKRGEAFILARFATTTVGSQVLVLPAGVEYTPPPPPANYIDELVNAKLQRLRISPSELCSDAAFIRRATLDIIGLLPTEAETAAFVADGDADKRAKLVDRLLQRPEFADIWAMQWAEILMIRSTQEVSTKAAYLYSTWLTEKIAAGEPLDAIVAELISASGGTFDQPSANFYQVETDPMKLTENVAQAFLGIRVQCAQCHNHPFDRWTMDDYYGFAAFFSQLGRKPAEDDRETIVFNRGSGETRHPLGNRVMPPKFLGGEAAETAGRDRRVVLAEWLTSADNPYFAPSVANRIWAHFFGLGIVEPVDDVRVSNPPSNPQLYEGLGRKLVEYKYDFRKLVRDICLSQAYQRSKAPNDSNRDDTRNFARALDRRLRAEILLDCVSQVTETKDKFRGLPLGARAVQIADGAISDYFLTTFGRAPRETVNACDVNVAPTLSQALHLLNGQTLESKIRGGGVVKRLLAEGKTPEQVIDALYRRCFSRPPTERELQSLRGMLGDEKTVQQALEDVFWALLNSREFIFNH
jgi:hypothetical protein